MIIFKKLIFALPFLIFFGLANWQASNLFQNPYFILSTDLNLLAQLAVLIFYLILGGVFFAIFTALASSWYYIIPVILAASGMPLLLLTPPVSFALTLGELFSFIITYLFLNKELGNYLTFKPTSILKPSIKNLITLLVIALSLSFYLIAENEVKQNGFKIPKSLIDLSLSFSQGSQNLSAISNTDLNQLPIPPEQLQYIKDNPQLLKQYGLDTNLSPVSNTMGPLLEKQINNIVKPYQNYVPIVLAVILFFTLRWGISLFSLFLTPLIAAIFFILEESGFTKFTTEMREVKKLVV